MLAAPPRPPLSRALAHAYSPIAAARAPCEPHRPAAAPRRGVACSAMSPRRVRAALFDMDGTLLDIEPLSTQAINQQCAPCLRRALAGTARG